MTYNIINAIWRFAQKQDFRVEILTASNSNKDSLYSFPVLSCSRQHLPLQEYHTNHVATCRGTAESRPEPLIEHLGNDLVSPRSTGEGNSALWPEGVEPGCTSLRPHLRADCPWGWFSFWRFLSNEAFFCESGVFWYRWVKFFLFSFFSVVLIFLLLHPFCNAFPFVL